MKSICFHPKVIDNQTFQWLQRGKQRSLVLKYLSIPMTVGVLRQMIIQENPKVQIRDLWKILKDCEKRGLIRTLYPGMVTGRIFFWTETGRMYRELAYGKTLPVPSGVSWSLYSFVFRGSTRLRVFMLFGKNEFLQPEGVSATQLKKWLRTIHPVSLNAVIRALGELLDADLVRIEGVGSKANQPLYKLSPVGTEIVLVLSQIPTALFTTLK